MQQLLVNETADKAADVPTGGFGLLHGDLKDSVEADDRVVAKQARVCRRIATIEKHIRKVWGGPSLSKKKSFSRSCGPSKTRNYAKFKDCIT